MPFRIAVIGVGGIGSSFAYHLARAGNDVTAIARPGSSRLQQLQRDQGIIRDTGERVGVHVADTLDESIEYDLVVVTLLIHQVQSIIPALQRSQAKWTQFMFNNFNPERLRDEIGSHRCSFGMPFLMATVDTEGKLHTSYNPGQKTLHGDQRWVKLFNDAGIPSSFEPNILLWLRCHTPMCVAFESICYQGQRRGGGASWAESMRIARGLHSSFALIKAMGYKLYPTPKVLLNALPTFLVGAMFWFISRIKSFRELLATGVNECRALADVMVESAKEMNIATPTQLAAITAMKPKVED